MDLFLTSDWSHTRLRAGSVVAPSVPRNFSNEPCVRNHPFMSAFKGVQYYRIWSWWSEVAVKAIDDDFAMRPHQWERLPLFLLAWLILLCCTGTAYLSNPLSWWTVILLKRGFLNQIILCHSSRLMYVCMWHVLNVCLPQALLQCLFSIKGF